MTERRYEPADPLDHEVVGRRGRVTIAVGGADAPGEVQVHVRGTTELFIAYAEGSLVVGRYVLVYQSRGHRAVDVMPDPAELDELGSLDFDS